MNRENLERKKLRILRNHPEEKFTKNGLIAIGLISIACTLICTTIYALAR